MSISQALRDATEKLASSGVPEARREATTLLGHTLGQDRTFLIAHSEESLSDEVLERFQTWIDRRAAGEPSQYITGVQDFYGRTYIVTPDVLIPRPETEVLVETALKFLPDRMSSVSICDVGTGSGSILIALLHELPQAHGVGIDISEAAIPVAERNAQAHNVSDRVSFLISDCFSAIPPQCTFDLIVSNPPYVSAGVVPGLQREVRDYEPLVALSPGPDGLAIIRRLITEAPAFLKDDGLLVMEIGFDQGEATNALVDETPWRLLDIVPDLQGIPRIFVLKKTQRSI